MKDYSSVVVDALLEHIYTGHTKKLMIIKDWATAVSMFRCAQLYVLNPSASFSFPFGSEPCLRWLAMSCLFWRWRVCE
jgi:hypothetical protein